MMAIKKMPIVACLAIAPALADSRIDPGRVYVTGRSMGIAGVGHNAFLWSYTEPALFDWTFSKHRAAAGTQRE